MGLRFVYVESDEMIHLRTRSAEAVPVDTAPLIDMVFQLLIFFMLTSSFVLHPGIRVTLPKAMTSQHLAASNIVLTLSKEHLIYWGDEVISLKTLQERLVKGGGAKPVLIQADRHAYVEKLIQLWDLCRASGYKEVHIATLSE